MDAGNEVAGDAVNDGDDEIDELLCDAQATTESLVAGGFDSFADVVEIVADQLDDAYDLLGREPKVTVTEMALRMVAERWKSQLHAQASWSELTDCDRLDAAFSELDDRRIVARQNFWCCQSCALSHIWKEADGWPGDPRGYVLYHQQATEHAAVEGDDLWLSYGSSDQQDDTVVVIANEVVAVLKDYGLDASWNGDRATKIRVVLRWQRRLPPTPAQLLS